MQLCMGCVDDAFHNQRGLASVNAMLIKESKVSEERRRHSIAVLGGLVAGRCTAHA